VVDTPRTAAAVPEELAALPRGRWAPIPRWWPRAGPGRRGWSWWSAPRWRSCVTRPLIGAV